MRNAIHKTLLPTKNRKFVREYTHGVSCRTTENFSKDNELVVVQLVDVFSIINSQHE